MTRESSSINFLSKQISVLLSSKKGKKAKTSPRLYALIYFFYILEKNIHSIVVSYQAYDFSFGRMYRKRHSGCMFFLGSKNGLNV